MKKDYRCNWIIVVLTGSMFLFFTGTPLPHKTSPAAEVEISFQHKVGTKLLYLDSTYSNDFGEIFTIQQFKYYISNIQFDDAVAGKSYKVPDSYFLINEREPASKSISIRVPPGNYNTVSFLIGVDSLKNMSGAQDGALDPLNGMFWTWNTGYIMAKLEGVSPVSNIARRMIEFHIGGFRGPANVLQRVQLSLPVKVPETEAGKAASIPVSVDLNKWFNGKHALQISRFPACTMPGKLALQYAENYVTMFSLADIQQE